MANVKELRDKIAARKAQRAAESKAKYAKMVAVAQKAPEKLEACLGGLADKCASMAEGWENLRENLGLVKASKDAPLKVRVAATRNYAKAFKRIAEEAPDKLAEALVEAYQGLNDIAADIEMAADQMGIELEAAPLEMGESVVIEGPESFEEAMPDIIEEAEAEGESPEHELEEKAEGEEEHEEEHEEEEKEASGSDAWVSDRDEQGQPKSPEKVDVPRVAAGNDGWVDDRDKNSSPRAPKKMDIPQAQGVSELNKAASQLKKQIKAGMSRQDYIVLADAIRSYPMPEQSREKLAKHIAENIKRANPRFSEGIFVEYAMGRGGSRGGPQFKGQPPAPSDELFV